MKKPQQPADSGWKEILDTYFPQFLEFFFPEIYQDIDFARDYTFLDKEFQKIVKDSHIGRRYADKLIKVYLRNGIEKWLLIHIEVQGESEEKFEERLYIYNYRIFDRYKKEVVTLAVLADSSENFRPRKYEMSLWGFTHIFKFPSVKLLDYRDRIAELEKSDNPFSVAVLTHLRLMEAQDDYDKRRLWKFSLIKSLYHKNFSRDDIMNLYGFIDWLITLPEKLEIQLQKDVSKLEEEMKMPHVTSAERIGIKKGKEEIARKMLEDGMDIKLIARYTGLSVEEIRDIKGKKEKETLPE